MNTEIFESLEAGDRVLFNDRKIPLEIDGVDENRLHLKGPQGGDYIMFPAEEDDVLLVASKGSREYASLVEDLRKVGKWEKTGDNSWEHTVSGRSISIEETETGHWTIRTGLEADIPKYGFASRKFALEEVEKLLKKNPEG